MPQSFFVTGFQISIHASAREATEDDVGAEDTWKFQSTLPRGKRQNILVGYLYDQIISIHASAREATSAHAGIIRAVHISIHASAREATQTRSIRHFLEEFQSTLPRGKRLHWIRITNRSMGISIHASAREATNMELERFARLLISIHASAREATSSLLI